MTNTRNDTHLLKEKFIAALEFSAPSILVMESSDQIAQGAYQAFKTIVMRYRKIITPDILFHPIADSNLFILSTFDPDLFLIVVGHADREALDQALMRYFSYLIHRYKKNHGLVLRPMFEKVSQKAVDECLLSHSIYYNNLCELILNADPVDAMALLTRATPSVFTETVSGGVNLIHTLILSGVPEYVEIILRHLPLESVLHLLTEGNGRKPLDYALSNNERVSFIKSIYKHIIPAGSKDYCCNKAAVRLIELLPRIPPIDLLFSKDHLYEKFFNGHPLTFAIFNNPKLLNMLLRRTTSEDILKLQDVMLNVYPYLDLDVAKKVYSVCPEIIYNKKLTESKAKLSTLGKFAKMAHPIMSYNETHKKMAYIKSQRKFVTECFDAMPEVFDRNIRSIILGYTANDEAEVKANHAVVKAMFDIHRLKAMYYAVDKKLDVTKATKPIVTSDPAMLVMQYATTDQHLFFILGDEIEKEQTRLQRWFPNISKFSLFGKLPFASKTLDHSLETKSTKALVNTLHL